VFGVDSTGFAGGYYCRLLESAPDNDMTGHYPNHIDIKFIP
jgi:hypothetical protein